MKFRSRIARRLAGVSFGAAALAAVWFGAARAASLPTLAIASPPSGTVVAPGSSVSVQVTASGKGALARGVGLVGENGLGGAGPVLAPPYTFTLQVPSTLAPGKYGLTSFGATRDGTAVTSAPITLDVELPGAPLTLQVSPPRLIMEAIGERLPLSVAGGFSGGLTSDLSGSSGLTLTSMNPAVASVDSLGMIRAVGPGTTTVNASVSGGPSAPVAVQVVAPAITPSSTGLSFGTAEVGGASAAQTLTLNNTDSGPLKILGLQASAGFVETDNCAALSPIAPNGQCQVTIVFKPTAQGTTQGSIDISNDAVIVPTTVYLSGSGSPNPAARARIKPSQLDFGRVRIGRTARRAIAIRNRGSATLHVFVTAPPEPFALAGALNAGTEVPIQIDLAPGHRARLRIGFSPMAARAFNAALKITSNDPSAPEMDLPIAGRGK
jgi:Cep192 domain 4/Bacterial Ig domain